MFCSNCGKRLTKNEEICSVCGCSTGISATVNKKRVSNIFSNCGDDDLLDIYVERDKLSEEKQEALINELKKRNMLVPVAKKSGSNIGNTFPQNNYYSNQPTLHQLLPDERFCKACGSPMKIVQSLCSYCGVPAGKGRDYCYYCGEKLFIDAAVCPHCGCTINNIKTVAAPMTTPQNVKSKTLGAAFIISGLINAVLSFIFASLPSLIARNGFKAKYDYEYANMLNTVDTFGYLHVGMVVISIILIIVGTVLAATKSPLVTKKAQTATTLWMTIGLAAVNVFLLIPYIIFKAQY